METVIYKLERYGKNKEVRVPYKKMYNKHWVCFCGCWKVVSETEIKLSSIVEEKE